MNETITTNVPAEEKPAKKQIVFSGILAGRELERSFFRRLAVFDPSLTITTNYTGKEFEE